MTSDTQIHRAAFEQKFSWKPNLPRAQALTFLKSLVDMVASKNGFRGNEMGAISQSATMDKKISSWVEARFPGSEPSLVVKHPWAKTWKLKTGGETLYLKHILQDGESKSKAALKISDRFEDFVPTVVAIDESLSVVATQDHNGEELKERTKNMSSVLPTYARIQAKSVLKPFEEDLIPTANPITLLEDLISFLDSDVIETRSNTVKADRFLEAKSARKFHALFKQINPILKAHLEKANKLPMGINHCDLRPPNMARRSDGSISIFDWDDACWGPIGLSLHAQFSGCLRPHRALSADLNEGQSSQTILDRKHLDQYMKVFDESGVISSDEMRPLLSSSIVAGAIYYITNFKNYGNASSSTRRTIGKNISKRLYSILDVMDCITEGNEEQRKSLALAYFAASEWGRLKRLQAKFEQSLLDLSNLNSLAVEEARLPGVFPSITLSDLERMVGVCTPENAEIAAKAYREQGVVLVKNSFDTALIEECRDYFFSTYDDYLQSKRPDDALRVGNKRFMITMGLDGPINNPRLYAPPTLTPILERLLSDKMILGSLVAVASLPGAKDQSRHRDHKALFPGEQLVTPAFAVSVMIPLIDMTPEVGVTRLYKGTHLQPTEEANKMPGQDPVVPVGSCFLMDYRVQHQGLANKSKDKIRPILTLIYQRPWFRDYVNYDKQERLLVRDDELSKVPPEYRKLFEWK